MNDQVRELKFGHAGDDVKDLQRALLALDASIVPEEIASATFGAGTRDAVSQLQRTHGLPVTGILDPATARAIKALADAARQRDGGETATGHTVSGQVYDMRRATVGALAVRIVDKNAGPDVVLAEGKTDADGVFIVQYSPGAALEAGKGAPDLQVQAVLGDAVVGRSAVRYNAPADTVLDVQLEPGVRKLPSEFESLTSAIGRFYKGDLGQLQEGKDRSDITYLANKTGWDARAVVLAALADQFAARTRVPSMFFYALFRAGMPTDGDAVFQADADTLAATWKDAIGTGLLPESAAAQIPDIVAQFRATGAEKMLATPALAGTSAYAEILKSGGLPGDQQERYAQLYMAGRNDLPAFWNTVTRTFGEEQAKSLQLAGKMAFLTLNNAPLMQAAAADAGSRVADPARLVASGFHDPRRWAALLTEKIPVPDPVPGDSLDAKRQNYADYLGAQLRLSYPTASMGQLVNSGVFRVEAADKVGRFLAEHQDDFVFGTQSIEQYAARNKLALDADTMAGIKRMHRVHQLTASDAEMTALLDAGLDSAWRIVQHDRDSFADKFADALGAEAAKQIYNKAMQIHGAVLNVTMSYLTASNAVAIGNATLPANASHGLADLPILDPKPAAGGDVIAYATLENLFGSMDFCHCDECRSILSPAAYLVDLLQSLDKAAGGLENAQKVLLERRPDLQHLPLTCENTNTALPYIDIVNEMLEYYIANTAQPLSLKNYHGHDTSGTASDELIANPQNVMDATYAVLEGAWFPPPLPFHHALETLRKYFTQFGMPLADVMEALRSTDDLERGAHPYAWRDIMMEQLGLSREEHRLLTDGTLKLGQIYGFSAAMADAGVLAALSNAKAFARRVKCSYEDLVEVLKTRFVNPDAGLIPKLHRLGVTFTELQALKDGSLSDADFLGLLPAGAGAPDAAEYGGDIVAWAKDPGNFARIMGIITLADPTGAKDGCDFGRLELRYAKPVTGSADTSTRLGTAALTRLLRFIRLWRKLGWTIGQTDDAICALYRADAGALAAADTDTVAGLDAGFLTLLPRLGIVARTLTQLKLNANRDLAPLLACWSDIGTHGDDALYGQMFLNLSSRGLLAPFVDDGYGGFLTDAGVKLLPNAEALRGAFKLTGDEFDRICQALHFDADTPLSLANISAIFRRGWLARTLKLSVRELLLLTACSGLDPFALPDIGPSGPALPAISQLVALVQALKARSLKSAAALYLVWGHDLSGKSAPDPAYIAEFARTLRGNFADIENQFGAVEDPMGDVLRARMTLVYGQDVSDAFFALLDDNGVYDTPYTHPAPALEATLAATDPRLSYDGFGHRLAHAGLLGPTAAAALKAFAGADTDFGHAIDRLVEQGMDRSGSFFARFPELKPLYDTYSASTEPVDRKRSALLAAFQPNLARLRKRELALQRLSVAVALDPGATATLADPSGPPLALHARDAVDRPLLDDVVAVGTPGLLAEFYFRDKATAPIDRTVPFAGNLGYASHGPNPLPAHPVAGAAISGCWTGSIETPDAGFHNLIVEADPLAAVTLAFDGITQPLVRNGAVWRNQNPLDLQAGRLYAIELIVENVADRMRLSWETPKRPREIIPARYLYASAALAHFTSAYVRILKLASLMSSLGITASEIAWLGAAPEHQVDGDSWLNALPTADAPVGAAAAALYAPFVALLDYARIKSALQVSGDRLLGILRAPAAASAQGDGLMFTLTQWDKASFDEMLGHLGIPVADIAHFGRFRRVVEAFGPIQALRIPAARLIAASTNQPDAGTLRDFQAALRARYAGADWRDVVKPINDGLRVMRRDALVAYILHQMAADPSSAHIDTPDKLFEYFLVDVQMDCCMQTSRIRHALSSIQLFVERCLLNLEPRVSPASIDAGHWKWMKRFRVWQANRKVFLFPENWLEPELRDDKSPLYKEIEGKLLQGDVTDDAARSALLNYLAGLADIAKLEPCGMFIEEKDAGAEDDVVHVVARSSGAKRKYYYRRQEFGYWTPWEQVKLEIEDNPLVPVVWNGRLLLLWVKILKETPLVQSPAPSASPSDTALSAMTLNQVKQDAKTSADKQANVMVRAVLYWSEFHDGQWQSPMTSDPLDPVDLGSFAPQGTGAFKRNDMRIDTDLVGGQLRVTLNGFFSPRSFLLYNTHSLPQQKGVSPPPSPWTVGTYRWFDVDKGTFTVRYRNTLPDMLPVERSREVLKASSDMFAVQPNHHVADLWQAPFFYADRQTVYYVTSTQTPVFVKDHQGIGAVVPVDLGPPKIPPLIIELPPKIPPRFWGDGGPVGPDPWVLDPLSVAQRLSQGGTIRQGLALAHAVDYGGVKIGPAGAISAAEFGVPGAIGALGNIR
jgi:hypothetical protein